MLRYFLSFFIAFLSFNSFAGSIKGVVIDSKNNSPLIGVAVSLNGTTKGTVTDIDGKYELTDLANGAYEIVFTYATYNTYKQNVTISNNGDIVFDMKMMPENTELKGTVVKSGRVTNTENAVINEIKNNSTIVSGVGAAQISKTNDRNAADVVKRIPGVTIQDDRFIVVRGLPDRYNAVWLNDAGTPSSESDKKAFSFDIIPAGLIDRVLVFKTPSPELPGDFAGGMVKVYTTSLADKNQVTVSLQTSSREFTTGSNFNYNTPSSTDMLGYDDGKRSIPKGFPDHLDTKAPDYKTNIAAWSKAFGNDWIVNSTKANPDARFSLALSNVVKLKKIKIGNTLGLAYSNVYMNQQSEQQGWDSSSKSYHFHDVRSVNNISAGAMDNIGVAVGNTKIEFKNLYNQIGTSALTLRNSVADTTISSQNIQRSYAMGYESRATYASQLMGSHKNNDGTRKYNWTLGYTDLFKNQPDLRRINFAQQVVGDDTTYRAQVPSTVDILNGGKYYSTLFEHAYSFNHQFTQQIKITKKFAIDVSAGNYLEYKKRSLQIRQLGYTIKSGAATQAILTTPINGLFVDSNIDGDKRFKIGEVTNPYDHYDAENKLIASFVSLKVPVGKHVTILGGARYEYNEQSINTILNLDTIHPKIITKYLLPSVNAAYNFTEKSLVRAAYGKTLNRPEFREWAPVYYYDFDQLAGNYGSLFPTTVTSPKNKSGIGDTLKVAEVQNFDVRYEFYPGAGEMIQVGGFYKSFTNPIQRVVIVSGGSDSKSFGFVNAESAYCYGLELDVRKNLAQLDSILGTRVFGDLTLVGNIALTKSELTIDSSKVNGAIPHSGVQGQSPYIINAGLYYQNAATGFQGSVLYNVFGPRMYAVGTTAAGAESIGEMPFQSLDISLSKLFHKHYMLNIGVQNLLNSRVMFMEDINRDSKFDSKNDRDQRSFYPGRYYSLGVKIKF